MSLRTIFQLLILTTSVISSESAFAGRHQNFNDDIRRHEKNEQSLAKQHDHFATHKRSRAAQNAGEWDINLNTTQGRVLFFIMFAGLTANLAQAEDFDDTIGAAEGHKDPKTLSFQANNGTGSGLRSNQSGYSSTWHRPTPPPFVYPNEVVKNNALAYKDAVRQTQVEPGKERSRKYDLEVAGWPNYNPAPETISAMYDMSKTKYIDGGGTNRIYSVTLREPREGVPAGKEISLRVRRALYRIDTGRHAPYGAQELESFGWLSVLKNQNGHPVCYYYPDIYGTYFGPHFPSLAPASDRKDPEYGFIINPGMFYVEMEKIDYFFENEYKSARKIPDSVIFELCLGEWATQKIARLSIGDNKWRHYGLVNEEAFRVYHIGDDHYIFEPGKTPRRFDLDDFTVLSEEESQRRYHANTRFFVSDAATKNARHTLYAIKELGIFAAFSRYFHAYKIEGDKIDAVIAGRPVWHFFVPDAYLGNI